jgi:hypothetical protein
MPVTKTVTVCPPSRAATAKGCSLPKSAGCYLKTVQVPQWWLESQLVFDGDGCGLCIKIRCVEWNGGGWFESRVSHTPAAVTDVTVLAPQRNPSAVRVKPLAVPPRLLAVWQRPSVVRVKSLLELQTSSSEHAKLSVVVVRRRVA